MPLPFLLLFRFNPKQGCAPRTTVVRSQKSTRVLMNGHMCFVCNLVKLRVHTGNGQRQPEGTMLTKKKKPKPSRHLQSAHMATSHRHLCPFPLSLTRHQSLCSHTSPPATPTRITSTADPHTHPGTATATPCFRKVAILLQKNPPSGRIQYLLLLGQLFLLVFRIFTASPKRSSQH